MARTVLEGCQEYHRRDHVQELQRQSREPGFRLRRVQDARGGGLLPGEIRKDFETVGQPGGRGLVCSNSASRRSPHGYGKFRFLVIL